MVICTDYNMYIGINLFLQNKHKLQDLQRTGERKQCKTYANK